MKKSIKTRWVVCGCFCILHFAFCISATAFEGRINAVMTRGSQTDAWLYTVGTNYLRVEMTATNWPNPVDILDRNSSELTLLFPNNHSFVHLKPTAENSSTMMPPAFPRIPDGLPPGVGPQSQFPGASPISNQTPRVGPQSVPGGPAMPAMLAMLAMSGMSGGMPAMPMPMAMMPGMMEKMELQHTGQKTNLFGCACEQYEIKQSGETMEIWATDQLFPFQPYVQNQPHRFGPRMIEQQWAEMLKAKKLFPLLATLKFDNGTERFRIEVQSVTPEKLTDGDANLFQPPTNYFEIQPLPF